MKCPRLIIEGYEMRAEKTLESPFTLHPCNIDIIKHDSVAIVRTFAEEDDVNHFRLRAGGEGERVLAISLSGQALALL